jgi:predicted amidohydrolase
MNVIAVQYDISWENKPANFAKVRSLLQHTAPARESLVVLPEMFATGFSMNTGAIAETYDQDTEKFLAATAKEFGVCIVGGAAMRGRDQKVRNKALVFSPSGELLAFYAKMRPFTPGGEANHFTAGEKPAVFNWAGWKVSPFICYDLRFPELFRKAAGTDRPELFVVIANWPDKRIHHWVRLLQARAIENQACVVGVNRIGSDPFYAYPGRSLMIDPQGEIIADAAGAEGCISADLQIEPLRKYRDGLPFLEDLKGD